MRSSLWRFGPVVVLILLAVMLVMMTPDSADAQENPTGTLVVSPQRVHVGDTVAVLGFEISPPDQEVMIEYPAHLAPDGEPCGTSTLAPPLSTPRSTGSIAMEMTACAAGQTAVRLVAADTGFVIDERDIIISLTPDGVIGQAEATPTITLKSIPSSLKVGQSDRFEVEARNLTDPNIDYSINVSFVNASSLAFDSGCRTFSKEEDASSSSYDEWYTMYACKAPGTNVWAWVEEDGVAGSNTGLSNNRVTVRPLVTFEDDEYEVDEGDDVEITVELVGSTDQDPDIPISISGGDYDVDGLNSDNELEFGKSDTEESLTLEIEDDCDDDDDVITLRFGTLPNTVASGSITRARVYVEDDDSSDTCASPPQPPRVPKVYWGNQSYKVREGRSFDMKVSVTENGPTSNVLIPIDWDSTAHDSDYTVSGLDSSDRLAINRGASFKFFRFTANDDADCRNERINFSFGDMPPGILRGNPSRSYVDIQDPDTGCPTGQPVVTVSGPSAVTEGTTIEFAVTASPAPSSGHIRVPITFETTGNMLSYNPTSFVNLLEEETTKTFDVGTRQDTVDEPHGSITVTVGNGTGYTLGGTTSVTTAINDDDLPRVSISASTSTGVTEGGGITFTVSADDPVNEDVTVSLTNMPDGEFFRTGTLPPPSVIIEDDNSSAPSFTVETIPDTTDEYDGSIQVSITSNTSLYRVGTRSVTVPVYDDDTTKPTLSISANKTSITEGQTIRYTVTASPQPTANLSVMGTLANRSGIYYTSDFGTINANRPSTSFTVTPPDDNMDEVTDFIRATLTADSSYRINSASSSVSVTVLDNDPTEVRFEQSSYRAVEGDSRATVRVRLTTPATSRLSIPLVFTGSRDYSTSLTSSRVVINSGHSTASFTVTATGDSDCSNETVKISFGSGLPSGVEEGTPNETNVTLSDTSTCIIRPGKPGGLEYTPSSTTAGTVLLSWRSASNTWEYEVHQCKPRRGSTNCRWENVVDGLSRTATTSEVTGLDADDEHQFRIRAVRGLYSTYSDIITVDLKPAPENLEGKYTSGEHRRVILSWDPVINSDAAYYIEQKFPDSNPLNSGWEALPHDDVTLGTIEWDGNRLTITVDNLYPGDIGESGRRYEHRVKATSIQGKSDASNVRTTEVLNERPPAPSAPLVFSIVGNRRMHLEWNENIASADGYQIRVTLDTPGGAWPQYVKLNGNAVPKIRDSEWVDMGAGTGEVDVLGLTPDTYTFSVRAYNGSGESAAGTSRSYRVDAPTAAWGAHQADHVGAYSIDSSVNEPILSAISPSASHWNSALSGTGLSLCNNADQTCKNANRDGDVSSFVVEVSTPDDNTTTCGQSVACVAPQGRIGDHVVNVEVVFKNPPYECSVKDDMCPDRYQTVYSWTAISSDDHKFISTPHLQFPNAKTHRLMHAGNLVLHEFGHILAAPDFYSDNTSGLKNEKPAIMHTHWDAGEVKDTDVQQLIAIYRTHTPHK